MTSSSPLPDSSGEHGARALIVLAGFSMVEQTTRWEVYLDGRKLRVGRGETSQLALDAVTTQITAAVKGR